MRQSRSGPRLPSEADRMKEGSRTRRPVGRPKGSNRLVTAIAEAETRHALAGLLKRRRSRRKPARPPSMLDAVLALQAERPTKPARKARKRRNRRKTPVRHVDVVRRLLALFE
jgi:hypothetical protein